MCNFEGLICYPLSMKKAHHCNCSKPFLIVYNFYHLLLGKIQISFIIDDDCVEFLFLSMNFVLLLQGKIVHCHLGFLNFQVPSLLSENSALRYNKNWSPNDFSQSTFFTVHVVGTVIRSTTSV